MIYTSYPVPKTFLLDVKPTIAESGMSQGIYPSWAEPHYQEYNWQETGIPPATESGIASDECDSTPSPEDCEFCATLWDSYCVCCPPGSIPTGESDQPSAPNGFTPPNADKNDPEQACPYAYGVGTGFYGVWKDGECVKTPSAWRPGPSQSLTPPPKQKSSAPPLALGAGLLGAIALIWAFGGDK